MNDISTEDITKMVDENATQKAFDFDAYITAGAIPLPRETVECYTDLEAGKAIIDLGHQIDQYEKANGGGITDPADDPEMAELIAEREKYAQRVVNTAIVFELRGVAPAVQKVINRDHQRRINKAKKDSIDPVDAMHDLDLQFYRSAIQRVTIREHNHVVEGPLDLNQIEKLINMIPDSEEEKLSNVLKVLIYGIPLFDARVDAGFPRGSADATA
jgi:hypothetical protein